MICMEKLKKITKLGYRCKRCNWDWVPRKKEHPRVCPHCHSAYWDVEKTR